MVGPTRSTPNGFGSLGSGDLPPPPPTKLTEAFMATQTEVLRLILRAQQQMAHQLQQMQPMQQKPRSFGPVDIANFID
jgi:hypothetical protein